jgi:hypothetical protein
VYQLARKYDCAVAAGAGASFLADISANFGFTMGSDNHTFGTQAILHNKNGHITAVLDSTSGFLNQWRLVRPRTGGYPVDLPYPANFHREREVIEADLVVCHGNQSNIKLK